MAYLRAKKGRLYLRYYDSLSQANRKLKEVSLGLPDTRSGNKAAKEILADFNKRYKEEVLGVKLGLMFDQIPLFSELYYRFLKAHPKLSKGTKDSYKRAAKLFIEANGDKKITQYTDEHNGQFLSMMITKYNYSETSQAIYLRSAAVFFNYAKGLGLIKKNIIEKIKVDYGANIPIKPKDLRVILFYQKLKSSRASGSPMQFFFTTFMFFTGFRPSTAVSKLKVDFEERILWAINVKAGNKKFPFPLHDGLVSLFNRMGYFDNFEGYPFGYRSTDSTKFFAKNIKELSKRKLISEHYTWKSFRKNMGAILGNLGGATPTQIQGAYDHSDYRVSQDS